MIMQLTSLVAVVAAGALAFPANVASEIQTKQTGLVTVSSGPLQRENAADAFQRRAAPGYVLNTRSRSASPTSTRRGFEPS
jgi:hypothetical protein